MTMKKLTCALLVLLMVFSPLAGLPLEQHASAAMSGTTGDCTWTLDGTKLTISGDGAMADYEYYETSGGVEYTDTPWGSSVTDLVIGPGVTYIGENAFAYCYNLKSVSMGSGVEYIGDYAFDSCISLVNIWLTDSIETIGMGAFWRCTALTYIRVSEQTRYIYEDAFEYTNWFETQPNGVVYIGSIAYGIKGVCPTSVTIKEGTRGIADSAFEGQSGLYYLVLPNSIENVGYCAFYACTNLTDIWFPPTLTSIEAYAFEETAWLNRQPNGIVYAGKVAYTLKGVQPQEISLDAGTVGIAGAAFENQYSLNYVTLPAGLKTIGPGAFYGCSALMQIIVPESVREIGANAFANCGALNYVWFEGDWDVVYNISIYGGNDPFYEANWNVDSCLQNPAPGKFHDYDHACDPTCNICGKVRETMHYTNIATSPHVFENSTSYPFTYINGSYLSTNQADHSSATFTVRASHTCDLFIAYMTSSERNYDKLTIYKNSTFVADASGETDLMYDVVSVAAGDKVTFTYSKDSEGSVGEDCCLFTVLCTCEVPSEDLTPTCSGPIVCSYCGVTVKEAADHAYDNACDAECNTCSTNRVVPDHVYDNACDSACNECGTTRVVPDHVYDNDCDPDCNVCGLARPVSGHVYTNHCDDSCNSCGATRKAPHVFDDAADLICNVCSYERPAYIPGDVDGNGELEIADAIHLLFYINFSDDPDYAVNQPVDFDGNGEIEIADAIYLLYHVNFEDDYPLH